MTTSGFFQESTLKQNKPLSITQWWNNIRENPNAKWVAAGGGAITDGLFLTFSVTERNKNGDWVKKVKTMIGYIPAWLHTLAKQHKGRDSVVRFDSLNLLRIEEIPLGKGTYIRVKPFSVTLTRSANKKITTTMMGGDLESQSGKGLSGSCVVFDAKSVESFLDEGRFLDEALDLAMYKLDRDYRFKYEHFDWSKTNLVSMNSLIMDDNNELLEENSHELTFAKSNANEIGHFLYDAWRYCKENRINTSDPQFINMLPNYLTKGLNTRHYRTGHGRTRYMRSIHKQNTAYQAAYS